MFTEVPLGAQLLDNFIVGWRDEIVVKDLDMSDPYKCVLGQLFGGYYRGLTKLGIGAEDGNQTDRYDNGFSIKPRSDSLISAREWEALRDAWIYEISKDHV